ncbi:MAG: SCO family protein [Nocardioidaceae bacterium]|nr:SCO family protein [Nocardioidaceae bacterium]MCL2613634.1 SCO family protein [Nocardioidaceae bacterium]
MRRKTLLGVALALVAALGLAGCGTKDGTFSGDRLKSVWPASTVALTDTHGSPYSLATDTEDHRLTLVFFGYTHCPDLCPITMNNIAAAFNRLDDRDRARTGMVFVTSDPRRDTTSVLRSYLDGYNKSFVGLTGSLPAITRVATPFHIYISSGKLLPSGGRDLGGHSTIVLGMEDGKAVVLWKQGTSATEFASDIHSLLNED